MSDVFTLLLSFQSDNRAPSGVTFASSQLFVLTVRGGPGAYGSVAVVSLDGSSLQQIIAFDDNNNGYESSNSLLLANNGE